MALAFVLGVLAFFAGPALMKDGSGYVSVHDPIPGGRGNWKTSLGATLMLVGAGMAIISLGGLIEG